MTQNETENQTTFIPVRSAALPSLPEAGDEKRLLNLQRKLARLNLLVIDELGFVPLVHYPAALDNARRSNLILYLYP